MTLSKKLAVFSLMSLLGACNQGGGYGGGNSSFRSYGPGRGDAMLGLAAALLATPAQSSSSSFTPFTCQTFDRGAFTSCR